MSTIKDPHSPALLALVEPRWIEQAFIEMNRGKTEIFFGTNSAVGGARRFTLRRVYFKVKKSSNVQAVADLVGITDENPRTARLAQSEQVEWKFYYGFRRLRRLEPPLPITALQYHSTKNPLRNDVRSACVIVDPDA